MSAMVSDSSEVSDQEHSHKSSNRTLDQKPNKSKGLQDKLEQYKNQHAPSRFWQFAWLFNHKKQQGPAPNLYKLEQEQNNQSSLTKIKQQIYQGEQHSKQPLFHLSLCGNLLKRKQTRQEVLKTFYDHRVEYNQFIRDPTSIINDGNLVVKIDDSIYTWQLGITILTCRFAFGRELTKEEIEDIIKNKFTKSRLFSFISGGPNITKLDIAQYENENDVAKAKQLKKIKKAEKPVVKYKKTPDTDVLKKMKLKYGKNIAKFQLDVGEGIKQTITMKIFLWDHSEKIIISDIDGTITRSDILGQILNKWIHTGVTKLFNQIYKRHYKIIYLTARAIGQYQQTSKFLETVQQQNIFLPQGPLLMSPDGYMRSFTREVIYKTPDYLKTKILASLNQLFPNTKNPIYCGFGNRQTDSAAYLKINIAPDKIFCITDKSIISRESDKQFSSSYKDILTNINDFFPEYFKDNAMVESDSDEMIESYEAVEATIQQGKKTKSVDGDRLTNLEGYEFDELSHIGNLSKSRKSQHEIKEEDLRSLEEMKLFQKPEIEKIQIDLMNFRGEKIQIKVSDPATKIAQGLVNMSQGNDLNSTIKVEKTVIEENDKISKQELETIVMKQLKQENEVSENEVIPDNMEQESKSQDSRDNRIQEKTASEDTKSKE